MKLKTGAMNAFPRAAAMFCLMICVAPEVEAGATQEVSTSIVDQDCSSLLLSKSVGRPGKTRRERQFQMSTVKIAIVGPKVTYASVRETGATVVRLQLANLPVAIFC
jgi:hypothetical protein